MGLRAQHQPVPQRRLEPTKRPRRGQDHPVQVNRHALVEGELGAKRPFELPLAPDERLADERVAREPPAEVLGQVRIRRERPVSVAKKLVEPGRFSAEPLPGRVQGRAQVGEPRRVVRKARRVRRTGRPGGRPRGKALFHRGANEGRSRAESVDASSEDLAIGGFVEGLPRDPETDLSRQRGGQEQPPGRFEGRHGLVPLDEGGRGALDHRGGPGTHFAFADEGSLSAHVLEEPPDRRPLAGALGLEGDEAAHDTEESGRELVSDREPRRNRALLVASPEEVDRRERELIHDHGENGQVAARRTDRRAHAADLGEHRGEMARDLRERRHVHRLTLPLVVVRASPKLHLDARFDRARSASLAHGAALVVQHVVDAVDGAGETPRLALERCEEVRSHEIDRAERVAARDPGRGYTERTHVRRTRGPEPTNPSFGAHGVTSATEVPRVVSVNVGKASPLTVRDREVQSGIFKQPVVGPCEVTRRGLAGDERVEVRRFGDEHHAVHAYPVENYRLWSEQLGLPLGPGHFGENLTVSGLSECSLRIGDVLSVGTAVLQVSQPRIPCRKLDARMGFRLARRFLESRRVGFHLRVLEPGFVEAGDEVRLVDGDPGSPTVDEFVRVAQFDYWDAEALAALLRARHLMPAWVDAIGEKLARARAAKGWFGLRELVVVAVQSEERGASSSMACARGKPLPPLSPGQVLPVALGENGARRALGHALVASCDPERPDCYRVSALHPGEPGETVSNHSPGFANLRLPRALGVGARVWAGAPTGEVVLPPGDLPVAVLSEGLGAAVAASLLRTGSLPSRTTVFHAPEQSLDGLGAELGRLVEQSGARSARDLQDALGDRAAVVAAGSVAFVERVRTALGPGHTLVWALTLR